MDKVKYKSDIQNIKIENYDNIIQWSYNLAREWIKKNLVPQGYNSARKFEKYKRTEFLIKDVNNDFILEFKNFCEKENLAQRQIDQVNNWLDKEKSSLERKINNFNNMLFEYAQQLREEDPGMKTHSLPFGKLQFRKRRPKWQYGDELLDTVKETIPDAVRVKEDVDKRGLKKIIKDSGRFKILDDGRVADTESGGIVEGLKVVDRGESFKVKTV